jgi:hypothetical protein
LPGRAGDFLCNLNQVVSPELNQVFRGRFVDLGRGESRILTKVEHSSLNVFEETGESLVGEQLAGGGVMPPPSTWRGLQIVPNSVNRNLHTIIMASKIKCFQEVIIEFAPPRPEVFFETHPPADVSDHPTTRRGHGGAKVGDRLGIDIIPVPPWMRSRGLATPQALRFCAT